jgi:hypothetical protein
MADETDGITVAGPKNHPEEQVDESIENAQPKTT